MSDSEDSHNVKLEDEMGDIASAPSLYSRPAFFRQTRTGKILKTVNERYYRDDLGFGCHFVDDASVKRHKQVDEVVGKPETIESASELLALLQPCQPHALIVCDANVLLHNIDVLEQADSLMPNIVIPQTALMECRANRMVAYDRTVELLRAVGGGKTKTTKRCGIFFADPHHAATQLEHDETKIERKGNSINDENDARIRKVADYFGTALKNTGVRVILLTDDAGSRTLAAEESSTYQAKSVREWVKELERFNPGLSLLDQVAQFNNTSPTGGINEKDYFEAHLEAKLLLRGVQAGMYHRGVLRSAGSHSAMITIRQGDERVAVTIPSFTDRNRAVDGDVVAVALHPLDKWITASVDLKASKAEANRAIAPGIANETAEPTISEMNNVADTFALEDDAESLRPTGKVVGIIRRNFSTYSGSIYAIKSDSTELTDRERTASDYEREHPDGSITCVFFPVDKKIPPILIRTTQRDRLFGQRIVVAMDSWPSTSIYPLGHYVRVIGPAGSKDVETEVLLQEHDIPHEPFPAAVLACLPPEDYRIDVDNSPGRQDIRHIPVLSIDPPNCKDIDDALHCTVLPNGNFQVGVHIADVTHYVQAGTAIDLEAANRSTSTYLVNKRLDMLPSLLTTDLCSLKGNVDRYAFSVLWEVTPEAEILNVEFQKTIIHSIAALTYQQAQTMIDQPDDPNDIQSNAVKRLASLARKFRKRRIDAGALTLASPEVKFVLDSESLNPTDVQAYALLEANAVVEEFMLLANVTVSKKILRHFPTLSVLRRHPAPNRAMFDSLISKAKSKDLDINIDDSKRLADSLDAAVVESDPYVNKLLRILSTRCMSPAQYFCSGEFRPMEWHHYGLAAPVYTHFTSPIRRYADVCVHRLLAAAVGVAPLPPHLSSKSYLHDLCANMNRRHRAAQLAGRASVQLHTLIFFAGDGAKEEQAYILDVETAEGVEPSFTVIVPRYGIEGRVKLPIASDDSHLQRLPDQHKIIYAHGSSEVSLQVFDRVQVRIWVRQVQDHQRELVLDLVDERFDRKQKGEDTNQGPRPKKMKSR
jgi:exosome complex exonuclease DIS3/RRP44